MEDTTTTNEEKEFLSTGQVAKLLSVTPDTVLKWIKKGKIQAMRTAGGHFRVHRKELGCLLETRVSLKDEEQEPVFCWEYHARDGRIKDECRDCLVYRARARRCYEMSSLHREDGFAGTFCKTSCRDCNYYREQVEGPVRLLVVTDSVNMRMELAAQASAGRTIVRFASSEYECSTLVDDFQPQIIVIDSNVPGLSFESLVRHLDEDPRIPGVRIVVSAGEEKRRSLRSSVPVFEIGSPFSLDDLKPIIQGSAERTEGREVGAEAG